MAPTVPPARRRAAGAVACALAALALLGPAGCGGGGAAGPARFGAGAPEEVPATPEIAGLERAMHARLNRDRARKGLGPVAFDPALASIARGHSKDMSDHRFFAHESPRTGSLEDRLDRAGYLAAVARENLGEGPDVERTQDGLLASPGHHANIMAKDVSRVGIGIVKGGVAARENLLVTQVFATPIEPVDPGEALLVVAARIQDARRAAGLRPLPRDAKLDELARKHVGEVPDDLGPQAAERIGQAVTGALTGSGLRGVMVGTSLFLTPAIYEAKGAVVSKAARAVGIAAAPAKDERGRPAIKVLFLVGM